MGVNRKDFPILLKKELDLEMVGQTACKKSLAIAVYRHIYDDIKCPILLYGPTGSGKNLLFQLLEKSRLIPEDYTVMIKNVSRCTEEGYKGQGIGDVIKAYFRKCNEQKNKQCKGLLFLDEFDKLTSPDIASNDNGDTYDHNQALLYQIMQVLDGESIDGVSTKNILFVFGGAFNRLYETENTGRKIGFYTQSTSSLSLFDSKEYSIRQRLLDIGIPREFLGRINEVTGMDKLGRNELKAILLHPTRGTVAKLKEEYAYDGIFLEVSNDAVDEIVDSILEEDLGARSIKNIMECLLKDVRYDCLENGFNHVLIDNESLRIGYPKLEKKITDSNARVS